MSFTISWNLFRFMSIELMMPSNHLILCCPLLLLPSLFPSIMVCWGPAWGIPFMTRSCGRKPDKMQGRDQASGVPPGISWASTPPKIRICLLFHSSNILWKKSNQGFSLLHLKGMFQLNPSHSSLACLTGSSRPLTACELLTAPQLREVQSLKHLKILSLF